MSEKKELSSTSNESKNNSSLDYGSLGNTTLPVFDDFDDPKQNLFSGAEFTYEPSHFIETIGFGKSQIIFILITSLGFISEYGLIQLMPLLSTHLYVSMGLTEEMESALGVASYSGFAVGYPLWGFISDKIGRKSATLLSALWVLLWSLLSCVAPDVYWLIVTRILFSFGAGEETVFFGKQTQTLVDLGCKSCKNFARFCKIMLNLPRFSCKILQQ